MTPDQNHNHKMGTLVKSCRILERMNRSDDQSRKSYSLYFRILGDYFQRICTAVEQNKPMVLHTVFLPPEIMYAMDIVPMHAEMSTWMTAIFSRENQSLLDKAAEIGLATEVCSAHRGLVGAFALNFMPRPNAIIWSSLMCDNTAKSGELLMEINRSPGFFVDHPFSNTDDEASYFIDEMKDLIGFLEEHTGHRMNWEKLSQMIERLNHQIDLAREITELRKSVPSPFPMQRFLEMLMHYYLLPGQPDAIQYLEALRDDLRYMTANRKGAVTNEKYRLMSLFVPPVSNLVFLNKFFEERGVASVIEPFFNFWGEEKLDPNKPLESLAQKSHLFPEMSFYGLFQRKSLEDARKAAKEYKVDGTVFYSHLGCRQAAGTVKFFQDTFAEEDIPFLAIDFDLLDPTVASESEIKQKLEQLLEVIDDHR